MKMIRAFALAAILFVLALPFQAQAGETTYYLLRHAEKITTDINNSDPGLTEQGYQRAAWMTEYLAGKGITRIFSSDYERTLETVAGLSGRLDIPVEIYDPRKLPEVAELFKTMEGVIVVAGHSNTTPALARLISGQDTETMPESEYDRFYEIRLGADGDAEVIIHRSQPSS